MLRRLLRHPAAALRLARALIVGAAPQLGRQLRIVAGDAFARDLASSLLADEQVVEVAFERDGMVWRSDLSDEVGRRLFQTGGYEVEEIDAVLAWLRAEGRSGVVVDVGANIGTTTVPFARVGFPVLAIEPVPRTHGLLRANVEAGGLADAVTTVAVAVAAERGEVEMWVGFGLGRSEVAVDGVRPDMRSRAEPTRIVVPTAPLDEVLAENALDPEAVALVWADVQGCETDVVRTAPRLWAAGVPLWLEVDPGRLERQAGLDVFLAAVAEHFGAFVPRSAMLADATGGAGGAGGAARPIAGFPDWVGTIPAGRYEDALLLSGPG